MFQNVLPLASNGTVFVDPPSMRGVPVAKILEDGPYWVQSWISFEKSLKEMEDRLDTYEEEILTEANPKRPAQPLHVLSGLKKYFDEQGFHPNQLLAKKHVTDSGLVHIDILQKIKGIMEALHEARQVDVIQIDSLSWLRGRLAYVLDKENQNKSVKDILGAFDKDAEFETVLNVCDMILRSPGHVRGQSQTRTKEKHQSIESIAESSPNININDVRKDARKEDLRRLSRKTYVPAHVNRHLKQQYKTYRESKGRADKSCTEESPGYESEVDAEDDDEYVE